MAQLTMDKLVALAKTADSSTPAVKSTAVFQTLGTTALSASNSKQHQAGLVEKFVVENPYNVGLDSAIIMNPTTWQASGHIGGFPIL